MTTPQDIRALEDRRYKAMVSADRPVLEELLADDLIYTHSNAVIDTKQSYIDGILGGKWAYAAAERPIENIDVFGDCARVTGQAKLSSRPGCAAKRVLTRAITSRVTASGSKQARGGTRPGPSAPKASRLSLSKFHWPPSGASDAPSAPISTRWRLRCSR